MERRNVTQAEWDEVREKMKHQTSLPGDKVSIVVGDHDELGQVVLIRAAGELVLLADKVRFM